MRGGSRCHIRSSRESSCSNRRFPPTWRPSWHNSTARSSTMSEPRRFRLLVFDWDGTLADSTAIIAGAIQQACMDLGLPVPDDVAARYVIGLGLADAMRHVAPTLPIAEHPRLSERYRHHYLARDPEIPLFAGAREMLDELDARGFLLAIATGKSRVGLARALTQQGLEG